LRRRQSFRSCYGKPISARERGRSTGPPCEGGTGCGLETGFSFFP
jgi:hypothetical protein